MITPTEHMRNYSYTLKSSNEINMVAIYFHGSFD